MTNKPTKFKGSWKHREIYAEKLELCKKECEKFTKEQLIEKYAQLLSVFYPIRYPLSALDSRGVSNGYSRGCVYLTSDFFPMDLSKENELGEGKVFVTKYDENNKCYFVGEEPTWDGTQNINHEDSLSPLCTVYIDDKVSILSTYESAMACSIVGGSITFGDVRIADAVASAVFSEKNALLESLLDDKPNDGNESA